MPERQRPANAPSAMRAPTLGERAHDWLVSGYETLAEQPLGRIADLLGLSDFAGMGEALNDPGYRDELKVAAVPRRRTPGAVKGSRIPTGSQSSMGAENKIPRFRSEHGTFVKHQGAWWRIGKQVDDGMRIELEQLPSGPEIAELVEAGEAIPVLSSKIVRADALMPKRAKAK